jgi:spermidine synthase
MATSSVSSRRAGGAAPTALLLRLFMLSGAAGLVYEVVWQRQLVLVFGTTTQSVSAILTGFFGGMVVGNLLGGWLADRARNPLRLYAALELAAAALVLATPASFHVLHQVYRGAYASLEQAPLALAILRYILAVLALAPATALLGATLPALARCLAGPSGALSPQFGRLYLVNTLGGIVGAAAAGFVLIEVLGLQSTLWAGAACALVAGLGALWLAGRTESCSASEPRALSVVTNAGLHVSTRLALTVAAVSGLTSLGYEVLWTRLLASGVFNTTYIFSAILVLFLTGIAVGALVAVRLPARLGVISLLGALQTGIAAVALYGVVVLGDGVDLPFAAKLLGVVLPGTLLLGLSFPLTARLLDTSPAGVGRRAGLLLGANTAGVLAATFGVPFVLIPLIGSPRAAALLAAGNAALGAWLLLSRCNGNVRRAAETLPRPGLIVRQRGTVRLAGAAISVGLATLTVLAVAVPTPLVVDPGVSRLQRHGQYWGSAEDEIAAVQAGSMPGIGPQLLVQGTSMTALSVNMKLVGLLPLMLRSNAQSELVIAFGMGSTYRSALLAGLLVDGVELVPSVPAMFAYYFEDAAAVLANPRGRLHIADGRSYVDLAPARYDLAVADPPPPMEAQGTSVLYSREFYQAVRGRLNDGGVFLQLMSADQSVDAFQDHVRTFANVFPHTTLMLDAVGDIAVFLIGSDAPLVFDPAAMDAVLNRPGVLTDLNAGFDAPAQTVADWRTRLLRLAWLTDADARAWAGPGPIITDDRPLPEYFLVRRLLRQPQPRVAWAREAPTIPVRPEQQGHYRLSSAWPAASGSPSAPPWPESPPR